MKNGDQQKCLDKELNMYTYSSNSQLVIKTQVESHDKTPKDQRNCYM